MELRREPRIQTYQSVELTVLGSAGYSAPARAIGLSAHGMQLVLDRPVEVNAAVKVQADDWLVLGEVCYSMPERSHYKVGLLLDQALMGLQELAERTEALASQ